ncbi:MAG: ROK family protein [Clostridiales bacterium]|nr:ROK family protein [Clostridiales bacterium]
MRIAALDIGGTSIKSGIWDGTKVLGQREWDTNAKCGGAYLMEHIKEIIHTMAGNDAIDAIGISTAGQVDTDAGSIYYANENIPGYTGMQVRKLLQEEFRVPVSVENDVNAAALGELHFGVAKGLSDFLCLTYGTGVGGAIVIGGSVYAGSTFSGGSFGGIVVHPEEIRVGEDFSGCYEKYASTTALVKMAKKVDATLADGRAIFAAAERVEVKAVIDAWIDELVYGLMSLIHIFNPADIVLGGGVLAQEYVSEEVQKRVKERVSPGFRNVRLHQAGLGNQAGLLGAAWMAEQLVGKEKR